MSAALFEAASQFFESLQGDIVATLEHLDGQAKFRRDDWQRNDPPGASGGPALRGWGRTCVLEGGGVLERAGVAFSCLDGTFANESYAATMPGDGLNFRATGISLVLHPHSPLIATVHCNFRRLERGSAGWFGGGADLTPNYVDHQDIGHFRNTWRAVCGRHSGVVDGAALETACDRYFFLPHRQESRGVGGIFFDHSGEKPDEMWAFVQDAGSALIPSWLPIAERHKDTPWTEQQRAWQLLRRGRYVEFNLVCDRGTLFGLKTGGRIESILMSMPATANWSYDVVPVPGSPEAEMQRVLREGIEPGWLASLAPPTADLPAKPSGLG